MEEGHQLHVSATVLMQAPRSEACSSNDPTAKNNPGPGRRVAPAGMGARERPGMSQPAHGPVRQHHVHSLITQPFPRGCSFLPALVGLAVTIPPHSWVSDSGSPDPSFPVAFVPRWDKKCKAIAGAQSRWRDGTFWGEFHRYPEYCTLRHRTWQCHQGVVPWPAPQGQSGR